MSLIGTVLGNSKFYQDTKEEWIKIDNTVLGESKYGYIEYNSKDIGGLLDKALKDQKIVVLIYEWATGKAFAKTGFELNNTSDCFTKKGYTSFVVKRRVKSKPTPQPQPSTQVPVPGQVTGPSGFVRWDTQSNNFVIGNRKYYPIGFNCYMLGLKEDYTHPSNEQIEEIFKAASLMKATSIRSHTLGFSFGTPNSLVPWGLTFNEAAWKPIDYAFLQAQKYDIKLVIPLIDCYLYYHQGASFFCKNRRVSNESFYTDRGVINDFKEYISKYLSHINQYTGVAIKNSPEVFSIELGNELGQYRPDSGSKAIPTEKWLREIAQHIKSIDSNHLVMCPSDECLGSSTSNDYAVKEFDIYSQHFYWNDYKRMNDNAWKSKSVGKPYIIGEYSSRFGRDWFNKIESTDNVLGSYSWSIYPHSNGKPNGNRIPHGDGFVFWYDNQSTENTQILLQLTNHFRRMQGLPEVSSLTF